MENNHKMKNLMKRYHLSSGKTVGKISYEVKEGEFSSFLGLNSKGKTTTISILPTITSKAEGAATSQMRLKAD